MYSKIKRLTIGSILAWSLIAGLLGQVVAPDKAQAQTPSEGNNAIDGGSSIVGSSAFIDASVYGGSTKPTFCSIINGILGSFTSAQQTYGAVIDARGLNSSNATMACASGESPWGATTYLPYPSVLLLPATTITTYYTWVLPNNTKIIGQDSSSAGGTGTVILAGSAYTFTGPAGITPPPMIQLGSSACGACARISVEDLTLDGSSVGSTTIDGILNLNAQELSYARRVSLYGINGTGLHIGNSSNSTQAQNSGPYEQIYYYNSSSSSGPCVQIYGSPTRGVHGITCISTGSSMNTGGAILVDSPGNSLEDTYINGFTDGILVGSQSTATSIKPLGNVLININGGSSVTNLIHLCKAGGSYGNCTSATVNSVQDVSILGVTSAGTNSIEDDVTGATTLTDTHVGMYALGDLMANGSTTIGNSRLTTSPSVPTWFIGTNAISGTPACKSGSIYSNSGSGSTFWACANSLWGTALH